MHIIGVPYSKEVNITCHIKEKHFTAVLELGDMFYGGGVPIDHYIIQVEDGTQLEIPGPTYSFDIIRASVDALCRDGTSEISRDPRTKRLQTRRESLARPSKHTNNNF